MPLRIGPRAEGVGADVTDHGEEAYTHGDGAILVKPKESSLTHGVADVDGGAGRRPAVKLIVAIVRPEKLSDVLEALFHADVRGLTISRVQGHGGEIEHVENYRGTSVKMALAEKVRIEIGVSNHFVQPTIDTILSAARTGEVGDGKIMVLPIEQDLPHPDGRVGPGRGDAGSAHRLARRAPGEGIHQFCWPHPSGMAGISNLIWFCFL